MTLKVEVAHLLITMLPMSLTLGGCIVKMLIDLGAIKKHLQLLNNRVDKTECAYGSHIDNWHSNREH